MMVAPNNDRTPDNEDTRFDGEGRATTKDTPGERDGRSVGRELVSHSYGSVTIIIIITTIMTQNDYDKSFMVANNHQL